MSRTNTSESLNPTQVVVVGGGIAGCWAALKLAERDVMTTLVTYSNTDRGGVQGATGRSVGAINTSPLKEVDFQKTLEKIGCGQTHPSAATALDTTMLGEEIQALRAFAHFKPIKLGIALDSVNATELLNRIKARLLELGVRIVDAWVVRIVVGSEGFQGIQLSVDGVPVRLYARILVIASGGYAGLFHGSIRTPTYGTLMGRYLEAGGAATNLEFVFKHGYGKADLNALTPTEELPGAEVYDDRNVHVDWLERELFSGKGTYNHMEAFRHWRRNNNRKFYIDFTYRQLYQAITALNKTLDGADAAAGDLNPLLDAVTELCRREAVSKVREKLLKWIRSDGRIGFDQFNELKPFQQTTKKRRFFRVSQIAYFSMGGIAHKEFITNLPGVYVTGEAMHDFGANRVGGLPWGLYLIAGRKIADQCVAEIAAQPIQPAGQFDLLPGPFDFDNDLLPEIQGRLQEHLEEVFEIEKLNRCLTWFRDKRGELYARGYHLSDGYAWLLVAEAIMQAAQARYESRGCFFRQDRPQESSDLDDYFTFTTYNRSEDKVVTSLVGKDELFDRLTNFKRQQPGSLGQAH